MSRKDNNVTEYKKQIGHIIAKDSKGVKYVFYVFQDYEIHEHLDGRYEVPTFKHVETVNGGTVQYVLGSETITSLEPPAVLDVVLVEIKE